MEDPGGSEGMAGGGWGLRYPRGPVGDKFKLDELTAADAQLLGRVTYSGFAAVWPNINDAQGFAAKMNAMPKFVVSRTLKEATWNNSTILTGDMPAEVARLKQQYAGDILVAGSCQLVQGLMQHSLIDEYRLMVFPVVLGHGKRLFPEGMDQATLQLTSLQQAAECAILVYEPRTS